MKKVLFGLIALSAVSMAQTEGLGNLYFKFGVDVAQKYTQFVSEGEKISNKKPKDIGYELTIEGTKEVVPNFELGLGISYQDHGKIKEKMSTEDPETEYLIFTPGGYTSVPVYVTAKYNIPTESNIKPYLKADLGYSFNVREKEARCKDYDAGGKQLYLDEENFKLKVKNGAYFGVGAGLEYNEFVAEVMYKVNKAKVDTDGEIDKFDYSRVTLAVGYKLGF